MEIWFYKTDKQYMLKLHLYRLKLTYGYQSSNVQPIYFIYINQCIKADCLEDPQILHIQYIRFKKKLSIKSLKLTTPLIIYLKKG